MPKSCSTKMIWMNLKLKFIVKRLLQQWFLWGANVQLYYNYSYYYFTPCRLFMSAGGFSFEPKWQQVFSRPQDSSGEYSSWYLQYYDLYCLDSSSNFQFLQSLFQSFGDSLLCAIYYCAVTSMFYRFFSSLARSKYFFRFFSFSFFHITQYNVPSCI